MSRAVTRKGLQDLLRRIKADPRSTPETWRNMLFYNLAYALSHKHQRTLKRVCRTEILKLFGETEEGRTKFGEEFKSYVERLAGLDKIGKEKTEGVAEASAKAIEQYQGALDALADK